MFFPTRSPTEPKHSSSRKNASCIHIENQAILNSTPQGSGPCWSTTVWGFGGFLSGIIPSLPCWGRVQSLPTHPAQELAEEILQISSCCLLWLLLLPACCQSSHWAGPLSSAWGEMFFPWIQGGAGSLPAPKPYGIAAQARDDGGSSWWILERTRHRVSVLPLTSLFPLSHTSVCRPHLSSTEQWP